MTRYAKGGQILSLDELAKQEFVYCRGKVLHRGWFMSWQFRMAEMLVKGGCLHYAIRKKTLDLEVEI